MYAGRVVRFRINKMGKHMADVSSTQNTDPSSAGAPSGRQATSVLRYRQVFQQALPIAQKLAAKDLIPVNIDLPTAVTTTLGALPEILAFRDRAKALPEFDIQHFDQLETYALAAMHAHGDYIAASALPKRSWR
jgi:hypothetical protein